MRSLDRAAVVPDRPRGLEVVEEDGLDVEEQLDLVADDHAPTGEIVLPGDAEVVAVDPRRGLEADPAHLPLVLAALPPGGLPFVDVGDVERDRAGHVADRQLDLALERGLGGALGKAAAEADLGVVLDVEKVGAPQVSIASGLAGPDPGSVDLPLEGGVEAVVPVELQPAVDVLEQPAHPGDHHVPGAELGLGVSRLEDPGGHQTSLAASPACTMNATSSA